MRKIKSAVLFFLILVYGNEAMAASLADFAGVYRGVFNFNANKAGIISFNEAVVCTIPKSKSTEVAIVCRLKTHNYKLPGTAALTANGLVFTFAPDVINNLFSTAFVKYETGVQFTVNETQPVQFTVPTGSTRFNGLQAYANIPLNVPAANVANPQEGMQPHVYQAIIGTIGVIVGIVGVARQ